MLCSECKERAATLHFSKNINGKITEFHLCEYCAKENSEINMFNGSSAFSINNLLAGLLNIEPSFQHIKEDSYKKQQPLKCEECNMTFSQFRKLGRMGCPHCYETFKEQLQPFFKRLHGGNIEHKGKIPERIGGHFLIKKEIDQLRQDLKELINQEEFEKAAVIRDEIREKEKLLASSGEGAE